MSSSVPPSHARRPPVVRFSTRVFILLAILQFAAGLGSLSISHHEGMLLWRDHRHALAYATLPSDEHIRWTILLRSHHFEETLDILILLSMAATCFYVLRVRLLMHQQEKATAAVEAELRFERSTLEQRIQTRTAELRTEVEERRRAERLNRGRGRVLELLATNAPVDDIRKLLVSTIAEQRTAWNCALHRLDAETGTLRLAASVGLSDSLIKHLDGLEIEFADAPEARAVATGVARVVSELEQVRTPWSELLIANGVRSVWSMPVLNATGHPLGSLTIYSRLFYTPTGRDLETLETGCKMAALVHEHRRIHTELVRHASQDHLTGLTNRRVGESRLQDIIERAREQSISIAVLWIDLNRFKRINDVYGHAAGDAVLQEVAHRLTSHLRSTDLVARMGGDEFMVILENVSHREVAEKIAHSIAHVLRQPFQYDQHEIEMAASVGLSLCPEDGVSVDQLEKNADRAMYEAKWNGLPVVAFSPRLGEKAHERIEMEAALRVALTEDSFELHYQPQYSVGGDLRALEALLRFRHPRLGLVPPSSFIPVAEESGLIVPIGEWVLRTACRQCAKWGAEGFQPVPVAVNISPLQFTREDFAETVARILTEVGLSPELLEMELTESLVMSDFNESARQMSRLKKLGTRIAMDDFGTGYSSLSHLHRLPIDVLKIDRSFVEKLTDEDGTRPIVEAVLSMAHKLGLEVVAEGVETVAQLQLLRQAGCDSVQGFLFAAPQPAGHLRELLAGPLGQRMRMD